MSCAFRPGELTAIVGPNGAGKTTYFNLMSGQLRATSGAVLLNGADVTAAQRAASARAPASGARFSSPICFPALSVLENVRLAVQAAAGVHYEMARPWTLRARSDRARDGSICERVALAGKRDQRAASLSHGDQRKLEVAMMMALEPESSCSTSRPPA